MIVWEIAGAIVAGVFLFALLLILLLGLCAPHARWPASSFRGNGGGHDV